MKSFSIVAFLLFPFFAFAQDVPVLNQIDSLIPASLSPIILVGLAFLAEAVMRVWPTAKPRSFLIMIASALKSISNIAMKLSDMADKIVQNLKPDPSVEKPKE